MKKIYLADNPVDAHLIKGLLTAKGFPAWVSGDDVAVNDSLVWVANDVPDDIAQEIIAVFFAAKQPQAASNAAWRCAACGESLDGQFMVCWQCGTERSGL